MFRCPPQKCNTAQCFSQPFSKPGSNVFTLQGCAKKLSPVWIFPPPVRPSKVTCKCTAQSANFGKFWIKSLNLAPFLLINPVHCRSKLSAYSLTDLLRLEEVTGTKGFSQPEEPCGGFFGPGDAIAPLYSLSSSLFCPFWRNATGSRSLERTEIRGRAIERQT